MIGNIQIATEKDRKETQEIERRRQYEIERRDRIFNSRYRKIGVDVDALGRQLEEQKFMKDSEKRLEKSFDSQFKSDVQIAYMLAENQREERRRIQTETNDYRKMYQRKEDRREYDLNDPEALKKQQPLRDSSSHEIGLACAQKFEGEDLHSEERARIMAEQRMAWLQQQIQERRLCQSEQKAAEEAYMSAVTARDQRALQLELVEKECKLRLEAANARFNKALAEERRCKEAIDYENETQDNRAEMYNNLTSDMMTENPDVARSVLGPHRFIGYAYKGMSAEEKEQIRKTQMDQIEEQKARRAHEKKVTSEWEAISTNLNRDIAHMNCDIDRQRRINAIKTMQENMALSTEQREKRKYFDKIIYKNVPTEDYFNQFSTSSR